MSVSSQELNYLIWRYLQEAGLEISTYALQKETAAHDLDTSLEKYIPHGSLVRLVQKGIQFLEVEAQVKGLGADSGLTAFSVERALSFASSEQKRLDEINEKKKKEQAAEQEPKAIAMDVDRVNGDTTVKQTDKPSDATPASEIPSEMPEVAPAQSEALAAIEVTRKTPLRDLDLVFETEGTQSSQYNPSEPSTLAVGKTDGHSVIIQLDEPTAPQLTQVGPPGNSAGLPDRDVTALAWNAAGTLLVTGHFNGQLQIWTKAGSLRYVLSLHRAPILSIRFNASGSYILSVDCVGSLVVWDAITGDIKQQFRNSNTSYANGAGVPASGASGVTSSSEYAPGSDADWIDDLTYAATGETGSILIYKVGDSVPLLRFRGHLAAINAIQFDQATKLLASGSDDKTIRIWHGKSPVSILTLHGHTGPVMSIRWQTHGESLAAMLDPSAPRQSMLVSASTDATLRVWDPSRGVIMAVLALHEGPLFCCEISPDGRYVASGGADGVLIIWDLEFVRNHPPQQQPQPSADAAIARFHPAVDKTKADHAITNIAWDAPGTRIFVGYSSYSAVVDFGDKGGQAAEAGAIEAPQAVSA